MLHHQQSVPIPPNQLRDANRLGQVPMRMPQQQQQQRQPILMGMQPQGSGPGVLMSMPQPPVNPVMTATPLVPQPNNKNPSVLMGTEGDGVTLSQQRQQQQQQQLQQPQQQQQQQQQQSQSNNTSTTNTTNINVANTKEKTPMCLVNELARFNKILHQYRLTNEQGPAHKKRFTVTLKLGEEEYSAEGASIKKAQHSAASEALQHTQYKHPPPKSSRNLRLGKIYPHHRHDDDVLTSAAGNITPTVELNALAMKRGEPAVYTFVESPHGGGPQQHNPYLPNPNHYFNNRGMYNQVHGYLYDQNRPRNTSSRGLPFSRFDSQRYHHYGKGPGAFHPQMFSVSLRVGAREFLGEGMTAQAARHDAASRALAQLRSLPLPEDNMQHCAAGLQENGTTCGLESDPNADLKSPISLVHEIALKRNLAVNFEVESEKGPPHMRTFVTKCTVGDKVTTGEGNGKKVSKKRAAEKMLEELKKLPPSSPTFTISSSLARLKRKANPGKKKTRNLIKEQKAEPEYGEDINPISRLIQIQQAKKEREPVYSLVEERGVPRRREFVMEVSIGQHSATGTGPNKKLAKRAAAEGLLQLLGYSRPTPQPAKPSIKTGDNQEMDKNRKVTFLEDDKTVEMPAGGSSGRQLVPGLILMADGATPNGYAQNTPNKGSGVNLQTTATIAKELLKGGSSPTAEALAKSNHKNSSPVSGLKAAQITSHSQVVRPKDQLMYLAQLLGFQVQFSDFPKGNHSEFLSLVSLSTEPPQVCHGAGSTTDASHDQAALTALRALSEMGLDAVAPTGGNLKKEAGQGDGLHLNQPAMPKAGGISLGK
ncbi:double-stranded RNA-binding protein Staufen homolog 2 isoform X2 [Anabrus simplex]|uniref:double-stranded RNA-binding protein Staufen homolog 2 isoform X2 n=1 Tax=Anabrus simplex TaxID=316456 RepID=UPI0035A294C8